MSREPSTPERGTEAMSGLHPGTAKLIAYHHGQVSEVEASQLVEHLSLCEPCTQEFLEVIEFLEGGEGVFDDSADEAAVFRRLEVSLRPARKTGEDRSEERLAPPRPLPPRRAVWQTLPFAYSLAATLAIAFGLSLWRSATAPPPPGTPRVNVELYDLESAESERSADPQKVHRVRWSAQTSSVLLILNPPRTLREDASYGARLRGSRGEIAWESAAIVLLERRTFQIGIDRGMVPAGRYALEVFARTGAHERNVGTYLLQIDE